MIKADYLVIGSGPIGVFATKYLLEKNKSVVLIDNSKKKNFSNHSNLNLKKIESHSFVYDFQNSATKKNKEVLPISSKSAGGFTKVWGGTLNPIDDSEVSKLGIDLNVYKRKYKVLLETIPNYELNEYLDNFKTTTGQNIKLSAPILSTKKGSESFWSSEVLLNELLNSHKERIKYIDNVDVKNIIKENNDYKIITDEIELHFDVKKIFVCSGSFSSSQIASRMIEAKNFTISDSQLQVWPIFYFGKKFKKENNKFNSFDNEAYSKLMINVWNHSSSIKCQLYEINKESIFEIKKRLPIISIPIVALLRVFSKRIFLLFVYKDSEHSKYSLFKLRDNKKTELLKTIKPNNKISLLKFIGNFLEKKLLIIPFQYPFISYGSFHHGNLCVIKDGNKIYLDEFGQISKYENIHFVDSTAMKFIPSGPFTISSIIYSQVLLDKIFYEK